MFNGGIEMIFDFVRGKRTRDALLKSRLFNETCFYEVFIKDLLQSKKEVIIECPYITFYRMRRLNHVFEKLLQKG